MRSRRRSAPLILVLALAAVPVLAQGAAPTGSFTAVDNAWNAAAGGSTVVIAKGGTVTFAYPSGTGQHNVVFGSSAPTACVPPLPAGGQGPGWSSTCTFAEVGDYAFVCGVHDAMTGTVSVVANGTTPPPPPGAVGLAASELKLKRSQRGRSVKGSIRVARAGSRLDVRALVRRKALGETKSGKRRVGRFLRTSVGGARVSFKVSLSKTARRALSRRGRLRITVEIAVTPLAGAKFTTKKTVTLRAPA
ncbi:MAG: cupredoxin domain-containing protein [Solirubrobacteraceae bacterium]